MLEHTLASVVSGPYFQAEVVIVMPDTGNSLSLFRGSLDIASRLAAGWNAQFNVLTHSIRASVPDED